MPRRHLPARFLAAALAAGTVASARADDAAASPRPERVVTTAATLALPVHVPVRLGRARQAR